MIISTATFTGADDNTDISEILALSKRFPMIEWGILLSENRAGSPRYPSSEWIRELEKAVESERGNLGHVEAKAKFRLSAHLCGKTTRSFMAEMSGKSTSDQWVAVHGLTETSFNSTFSRAQVNFNAIREGFCAADYKDVFAIWQDKMDGNLITQHNAANSDVWKEIQSQVRQAGANHIHQVLIDASGGRGKSPEAWGKPISGIFTGYAGGLGPDNLITELDAIHDQVGDGFIWIDMEGSLRDADDQFSLPRVEEIMTIIELEGPKRGWL